MTELFNATSLRSSEFERYSRQIMLSDWGEEGQLKLKNSKVAIVGCGGLGNVAATYLAGAGVGHLTLIDGDEVELSNLHRQLAFDIDSCELNKADELCQRLFSQNDEIDIHIEPLYLDDDCIDELLTGHDLVLDCSDNFKARQLVNRWCVKQKLPLLSGSVIGWQGQLLLVDSAGEHGCYQCLFGASNTEQESAGNCNTLGVNPAMVGVVGSYQANGALQFLLGKSSPLASHITLIDGLSFSVNQFKRVADPSCAVCNTVCSMSELQHE
ncbi:MAG: HesA/MoeB/ThiF family protein [Psychrobium sp.]